MVTSFQYFLSSHWNILILFFADTSAICVLPWAAMRTKRTRKVLRDKTVNLHRKELLFFGTIRAWAWMCIPIRRRSFYHDNKEKGWNHLDVLKKHHQVHSYNIVMLAQICISFLAFAFRSHPASAHGCGNILGIWTPANLSSNFCSIFFWDYLFYIHYFLFFLHF